MAKTPPRPAARPALAPDALIATSREARIRVIEKRLPRRRKPAAAARKKPV